MLLRLPACIADEVAALLDYDDLESLTSISRGSPFFVARDKRPMTLRLPPTNRARAKSLLHGIHNRCPSRLSMLDPIVVSAPWHCDTLMDVELIQSVKNVKVDALGDITKICQKLQGLPNLVKLDVRGALLSNLDVIMAMTQLKWLDLSKTTVREASSLANLAGLEVLIMEDTSVGDLHCIRTMRQLQVLKVSLRDFSAERSINFAPVTVHLPSFKGFTRLHTLEIRRAEIKSTRDLIYVAKTLRHLKLEWINSRNPTVPEGEPFWTTSDVYCNALLVELTQLQTAYIRNAFKTLPGDATTLSKIPSLRAIGHALSTVNHGNLGDSNH